METVIKSKTVRGEHVAVVESTGLFGGIDYVLRVSGVIKKSSKDKNYILSEFDKLW